MDATLSIGRAWTARTHESALAPAVYFEGASWSYRALYRASAQAGKMLRDSGLHAGDRVILMMDNGPTFLAAFFGCQLAGMVPVPVSPKSAPQRVAYLLADSGAALVLFEAALGARARALHEAQTYSPRLVEFVPCDEACELPPVAVDAEACAFIQYTSGSTGDSKGVMISHRAALQNIRAFSTDMALRPDDVFSSLLPLFHDMGLVCFGLAPLLLGHSLVLYRAESLSLYRWLEGIGTYGVAITGASDSLLQIASRVVADPGQYSLSSLRMLICGSEPVRRASVETFGRRFGVSHAIKPAYGMAELTLCASLTPASAVARIDARGQVASGRLIEGVTVRIDAAGSASAGPAGVTGEILVRSPAAMSGYWRRPAASAEAFDPDGYLRTGDLGYLDADGYLYVVGRLKNMLIRGGEKYSPHDLETAAQDFPQIRRAAVVQLQSGDAAIVAVLEADRIRLRDAAALAGLARSFRQAAFAAAGIAPDACWFVPGGTIPATENGKIRHAALRATIEAGKLAPVWTDTVLEAIDVAAIA